MPGFSRWICSTSGYLHELSYSTRYPCLLDEKTAMRFAANLITGPAGIAPDMDGRR